VKKKKKRTYLKREKPKFEKDRGKIRFELKPTCLKSIEK